MELANTYQMIQAVPLAPLYCDTKTAKWHGRWFLNCNSEAVEAMGGPWNTEAEAVAAVLATGRYKLREGTKTPHMDRT